MQSKLLMVGSTATIGDSASPVSQIHQTDAYVYGSLRNQSAAMDIDDIIAMWSRTNGKVRLNQSSNNISIESAGFHVNSSKAINLLSRDEMRIGTEDLNNNVNDLYIFTGDSATQKAGDIYIQNGVNGGAAAGSSNIYLQPSLGSILGGQFGVIIGTPSITTPTVSLPSLYAEGDILTDTAVYISDSAHYFQAPAANRMSVTILRAGNVGLWSVENPSASAGTIAANRFVVGTNAAQFVRFEGDDQIHAIYNANYHYGLFANSGVGQMMHFFVYGFPNNAANEKYINLSVEDYNGVVEYYATMKSDAPILLAANDTTKNMGGGVHIEKFMALKNATEVPTYVGAVWRNKTNEELFYKHNDSVSCITCYVPMGDIYLNASTNVTVITSANQWVLVNGTWSTNPDNQNIVAHSSNGTLVYTGETPKFFHIGVTISIKSAGANDIMLASVFKNGNEILPGSIVERKMGGATDIGSTAIHVMAKLEKGDSLNLYVMNTVDTDDFTVTYANMFMMGMQPQ